MKKEPLAVVTMAYNEKVLLPVWLKHYERQVGSSHCFVIDHGSNDGSTNSTNVSVMKLPRTPMDEAARSRTVSNFCSSLFIGYKRVLFTDTDELIVSDPSIAPDLRTYASIENAPHIVTMFGVDVLHVDGELDIDFARPISHQRHFARPHSALCKPTLIAGRTDWMYGFHCVTGDHRPVFNNLFLFHIAHCDNNILYERQKKRNAAAPVLGGGHHSIPPEAFINHMKNEVACLPRRTVEMLNGEMHYEKTRKTFSNAIEKKGSVAEPDLWRIPNRFLGTF